MSHELKSRLRFLMFLAIDYNDSHTNTRAVFRLDNKNVDFYIEEKDSRDIMYELVGLEDLTEDKVYSIYRAVKDSGTTEE